ncbi:Fumarylacetoacetase [Cryphonectria parasitica EP155]|uniref:Fumarylacetoacetase n=1 Tax=Cryphonectria parasitica (strain ATCC 38755 / EP155) TaxID=660469 RepID=A0A9P4XU54_CRYP1|nr:Fumarylacetoacetase [Cryphonectria parasitica EP155]KAF3761349.1 Fumarylacetoacetase [Cryphonectria parasitica EP155]
MASFKTWVPGVEPDSDFSLANIPFGIITTPDDGDPHAATAIGSHILDLKVLSQQSGFGAVFPFLKDRTDVFASPFLNSLAALGRPVHRELRSTLQDLLSEDTRHPEFLRDNAALRERALLPMARVQTRLPMEIGDYTDFYAGYHHAFGVGSMWRGPANALQPNYLHLPVGYHGRASSIVVSGSPIVRPKGQIIVDPAAEGPKQPVVAPSRRLDIELELGCFVGRGNTIGTSIDVNRAEEDHIFGYVLVNDWSARDIQNWEYVPLGPFNGKNFATTISPWVVTPDALKPFRTTGIHVENRPEVHEYLHEESKDNVFDIECHIDLTTPEGDTTNLSKVSSKNLIWSFPQMLAHHTLGGCPMRTGDMIASGTISGTGPSEYGSLLEMNQGGKKEILLYGMDARKFLKDGDTVTFRASAGEPGQKVGFGKCSGRIFGRAA